jgi:phosphinothricin acetyltransferase
LAIYGPVVEGSATSFEEQVPTAEDMRLRLREGMRDYPWLVAVDGGERIMAYAYACSWRKRSAYRFSCEVSVYAHSDIHRQGVGRALYGELLDILKGRGFMVAYAGITLPNAASVRFHEACGFVHVGTFPDCGFKFGQWHSVGFWRKELADRPAAPELKSTS